MSSRHIKLRGPHPRGLRVSSSDVPSTDLRKYLTRKSVLQIAPRCQCEQLTSAVLSDCHCDFQTSKSSVFSWLSAASNSAKKRRSRKKKLFSDVEYPEVTANIVGPSFTPSPKGSNLSEELDADWSPGLKDVLVEPERDLPTHSDPHGNNHLCRLQFVG